MPESYDDAMKVPIDSFIITLYGTGLVMDIRHDGFYIVDLVYDAKYYFHSDAVFHEIQATVRECIST